MNPKSKAVSEKTSKKKKQLTPAKKFIFTVAKILIVFFIALSCAVAGILGGAVYGYIKTAAPIDPKDFQLKMSSFVYDSKGNEISQIRGDENRVWVDDKDIPQHVKDTFVALEDERFEQHKGVDFYGLMVAVFDKITHPQRQMRGASTITMQVVKVSTGKDERSLQRKVQEQWAAMQLEKNLEKWQILELYMNLVVTGPNIYGVQAASKYYFNKDVKDLTIAEAASIAGITNNPSIFSPITTKGRENNKKRQTICLNNMLRLGKITQAQYDQSVNEELKFVEGSIKKTSRQSYFVDQVIIDVRKDLMEQYKYSEQAANKIIFNGGIKIYTAMDSDVQKAMDEVFKDDKYFPVINKNTQEHPQASMVLIDPKTGYVRALYGGYGEKNADMVLNRATQIKRQPGSTFKPIAVYGPALDSKQITSGTVIDDVPVYLNSKSPNERYPNNYDFTYGGLTTIRDAIRNSINVVAAQVFTNLGADQSLKYLKRSGITLDKAKDGHLAPLALGAMTDGVNTMQLAAAYVPFVNKGMYYQPATYTKVTDKDDKIILERKPKNNIVYDNESTAYIMTSMMEGVTTNGTAYPYGIIKNSKGEAIPTAGKTGTTSDNVDKWFVGYSTYYVGATWYGYDNKTKKVVLQQGERDQALKIWNAVMTKVHKNLQPADFPRPSGIVEKNICIVSGTVESEDCLKDPRGVETIRYGELFIKGTEPRDDVKCDVHVLAKIDKESKDIWGRPLLAGPFCPPTSIDEQAFVLRKEPYMPRNPDDPYPKDWIYELPAGEYCTIHGAPQPTATPGALTKDNEGSKSNPILRGIEIIKDSLTGKDNTAPQKDSTLNTKESTSGIKRN